MLVKDPPAPIAGNLWMLGAAAYPVYLYRGQRCGTLFEGGIGAVGAVLRDQLPALGISGDFVRQVVVTHAHPDHVMAVPLFRGLFPGLSVLASAAAAKTLAAEKAVSFFCKMDDALTTSLVSRGSITEAHRPQPLPQPRIAVDRLLGEGDTVEVDAGTSFQVLETPGHSDCSLSFFEPSQGLLVISDATGYYMPEHDAWWPNYFAGFAAYVRSIERLAGLGAQVVCLSHNAAIVGAAEVADYFRRALQATHEYHGRIVAQVQAGRTVGELAAILGAEIHRQAPVFPVDFFQKNCRLLIQQSLAHAGISAGE